MNRGKSGRAISILSALVVLGLIASYALAALALQRAHAHGTPSIIEPIPKDAETATFAAGCFWSMEAIFKQLNGVVRVEPGYSGGTAPNPTYEDVETGSTGYAETANITYDPKRISYRDLLQVLLTVRDPTTRDQQGHDIGPQYRSVIFYHDPSQKSIAEQAIREVTAAHTWPDPIVTQVIPYTNFYPAEDYHLDYYNRHPTEPYCLFVIAPEIRDFQQKFKAKLK